MQNYGKRLKEARKIKGFTQVEAATRIGVPQQTWQRYESGKFDLKMSTIYNICKLLSISSDWLIGLEDQEKVI